MDVKCRTLHFVLWSISSHYSFTGRLTDRNLHVGEILLDGHDIRNLDLKWLRGRIGLVNQEPALFATTIAANILYGKDDATQEEIEDAATAANVHSFIEKLPLGYRTQVGRSFALTFEQLKSCLPKRFSVEIILILDFKWGTGGEHSCQLLVCGGHLRLQKV